MKITFTNVLGVVIITLIILLANLPLIITFVGTDPLVYAVQPFTLDRDTYQSGDDVQITSYRCNNTGGPLPVTAARNFYNLETGATVALPPGTGIVQDGCAYAVATAYNTFPQNMPSGHYILRGTTTARGKLKTVDVYWQTTAFYFTNITGQT